MSENNNVNSTTDNLYKEYYLPNVHKIGRATMAIAFVLAFLPVLFFVFVKGYAAPASAYVSVAVAISSMAIGLWLTEPLAYWPALGSAGTYIGYLSGNVGSMRFPVALNLQSTFKTDINTARGQIITVVGIVASVVVNLIILFIAVLGGEWLLGILPAVVIASFGFVMHGLMGSMMLMRYSTMKAFTSALPYLVLAVSFKLLIKNVLHNLATWGMAITVASCVALSYIVYKNDCKKDAQAEK